MFGGKWQQAAQGVICAPCSEPVNASRFARSTSTMGIEGAAASASRYPAGRQAPRVRPLAGCRERSAWTRDHVSGVAGDRERAAAMVRGLGELAGEQRPGRVQPVQVPSRQRQRGGTDKPFDSGDRGIDDVEPGRHVRRVDPPLVPHQRGQRQPERLRPIGRLRLVCWPS
jgi:hypothetical protein